MAGVKGRSGRKSIKDEDRRRRVIDLAWAKAEEILLSSATPLNIKASMVQSIVVKNMPQAVEMPNGIQITLGGILSAAARSKDDSRSVEAMARQSSN